MISKEEVIKISKLAMLELTPEEVESYTVQLGSLLSYFEQLQQLDLKTVEPTNNALVDANVLRDDIARPSLGQKAVVGQSKGNDSRSFVVPAIIEAGE